MFQATNKSIVTTLPAPAQSISDLARQSGLSRQTVRRRLAAGWSPADLLPVAIPQCGQVVATHGHAPRPSPRLTWNMAGRGVVGITLVGCGVTLAVTSMRANAWFGYSLTTDATAGNIFATLSVIAEVIACALPTANQFYWRAGQWGAAMIGVALMGIALAVVFFAASGFVVTNIGGAIESRAERITPAVEGAQAGLRDAKGARDRECARGVGPNCRLREATVNDRQRSLDEAMAAVRLAADPQADALGVSSASLRNAKAIVMVMLCLAAGYVIALGWGLMWPRRKEEK